MPAPLGCGRAVRGFRLPPFEDWLFRHGKSPSTAKCYVSHMVSAFQSPENAKLLLTKPEEAKAYLLQHESTLGSYHRYAFRSAVRAFDRFLSERGHPSICPTFPDNRRATNPLHKQGRPPRGDHPLADLLPPLVKETGMSWRLLELTKWKHVEGYATDPRLWINDPLTRVIYKVSTDILRKINLWAGGGVHVKDMNTPLVPREPLSMTPMSTAMMRSLARG